MKKLTTLSTTLILMALFSGLTFPSSKTDTAKPVAAIRPALKTVEKKSASEVVKPASKVLNPSIKYRTVHHDSERKGRTVIVEYPRFYGQPKKGLGKLNRLMKKLVNTSMPQLEIATDDERGNFEFTCDYKVLHASADLVSVREHFWYYTGGAHGNGFSVPFNYTMTKNGPKEITIENLFGKKTNLKALQNALRPKLEEYLSSNNGAADTNWIAQGTASLNDLSCISLDEHGVTFQFQSYQVACYADGTPSMELTYGELRDLFDSSSPVYKYVEEWSLLSESNRLCETAGD